MDAPMQVFLVSVSVLGLYYLSICMRVPDKRNLNYKGRLALYVAQSTYGTINDVVMAVFSVLSCVLFVWETYLPQDQGTPSWMFSTEVVFSTGFGLQYFLLLYTTPNVLAFLVSLQSVVDVVTTVPVIITLFSNQYNLSSGVGFLRFSRVMKFTRVLRLLRLMRPVNVVSSATDSAIRHQMILLISTILSILVVTTGFVQFLGNEVEQGEWGNSGELIDFHDALYFTVVTFTTVGYGDISPTGAVGRAAMLCIIAVTFVLVPFETSKLVRLTRMRSAYGGRVGRMDGHAHVIVACDVQCAGVADFLKEFFHEDHGGQSTRVVLLAPGEPTVAMKAMLLKHKRVTYLKGDAMSGDDLARVRADIAEACFVLTNRFTADTDETDSITVLRALNVKAYNPTLRTFVQIIEPENIVHVLSAGVKPQNVLCINSVKLGLLGQSCVFPGFSTVITNLVVSLAYSPDAAELPWHKEYGWGLQQEIYSLVLPRWFDGRTFAGVALMIYKEYASIMFAVGVPQRGDITDLQVQLNPGANFVLRAGQVVFLITEDQATIQRISVHSTTVADKKKTPPRPMLGRKGKRKKLSSAAWTRSRRTLVVPKPGKGKKKGGALKKTSSGSKLIRGSKKLGSLVKLRAGKKPKHEMVAPPDHGILEAHFTPATRARPKATSIDQSSAVSAGSTPRSNRVRTASEDSRATGRVGHMHLVGAAAGSGGGAPGSNSGSGSGSGSGVGVGVGVGVGTGAGVGAGAGAGAGRAGAGAGAGAGRTGDDGSGVGAGGGRAVVTTGAGVGESDRVMFRLPGARTPSEAGRLMFGTPAGAGAGSGTGPGPGSASGPASRRTSRDGDSGSAESPPGSVPSYDSPTGKRGFGATKTSVASTSYQTLVGADGEAVGAGGGVVGSLVTGEVGGSRGSLDTGSAEYKAGSDGADPDAPEYAMIPPPPGPESQLEPAALKLARATLVQSMTEVIDNMHGTVQEEFIQDLCAVLSTVSIEPEQQRTMEVTVQTELIGLAAKRRRSFLDDSVVKQPSFRRRALDDATRANLNLADHPGAAGIKDHIVVVCTTADDLQCVHRLYLIAPLRSTYLSRMPPVVILCPDAPDERMWSELSAFEDVLYVQGVPHIRDLKRAGIDTAECAVILARNTEPVSSGHFSAQDAEVVLTVLDIQACVTRSIRTLAELNCSRYMKHLGAPLRTRRSLLDRQHGFHHRVEQEEAAVQDDEAYIFESSYTSGKVLPANFLESLLCQAFFNPYIVSLVTAMIAGCPMGQTQQDKLRRNSFSVHAALPFTHDAPHQSKQCPVRSHGMQIAIPDDFTGTTYGELVEHLMFEYEMVPVALYRYGEGLGNDLPFVFTNPPAPTVVTRALDLVFVFAPCQLGGTSTHCL